MSNLISREEVLRMIIVSGECEPDLGYTHLYSVIKSLPSADRPTGEWIKAKGMMPPEFHGHHCCSECGAFANMDAPYGNREDLSKFCPSCGSRMLGEDGEKCTNITK